MGIETPGSRNLWQLLALDDKALETADVVELNLAVAKEIPSLENLDIARYCRIVDEWADAFRKWLPAAERTFRNNSWKWKNDVHFFRVGMLAGFLGNEYGIRYNPSHKHLTEIYYTNPGDLFLHGLIDTKIGSCGNMATLHVAIARRMCWPVSLACVKSHFISRFDNGEVVHNIEVTQTDKPGTFSSDTDEWYMKKFELPKKAIASGSDLRCLTAREMIGAFLSHRGRHYTDVHDPIRADKSFALSRALFHNHRCSYIGAMLPMLWRGEDLFNSGETGHPDTLFQCFAPMFVKDQYHKAVTSTATEQRFFPFAPQPIPTINSVVVIRNFGRKQIEGAGT